MITQHTQRQPRKPSTVLLTTASVVRSHCFNDKAPTFPVKVHDVRFNSPTLIICQQQFKRHRSSTHQDIKTNKRAVCSLLHHEIHGSLEMLYNYNDNDHMITADKVELRGWSGYGSRWGWDGPGRGQTSEAGQVLSES